MQLSPVRVPVVGLLAGLVAGLVAVLVPSSPARADGQLTMRGVYYKERSTRVVQPMIDGRFEVGDAGTADTHILVDAITSASVAAGGGGEPFDEQRYELGGGYLHQLEGLRLGGQLRASYEPDYTSLFGGLRTELELLDKNLVVGVAGAYGHDWIDNGATGGLAARIEGTLNTYLASIVVSQILSRSAVAAVTYDATYLSGFQSNPYRLANAPGAVPENHPDTRLRHAVAVGVRQLLAELGTTAIASYRFYADDWGIRAHTPELRVVQDLGEHLELGAHYRLHVQNAADFYQDSYPVVEPMQLVTGDEKLSAFTSHAVGVRGALVLGALGFGGTLAEARGELALEYVDQGNAFGRAGIGHVALTVPLQY